MAEEAESGKAYLHSEADVNGRPVIIIRVEKHVTGAFQAGYRFRAEARCIARVQMYPKGVDAAPGYSFRAKS